MFYIFWSFLLLQALRSYCDDCVLMNFPSTIPIRKGNYKNWANELKVKGVCIATPDSESDVVALANWAHENRFRLRASGFMHNWSPLTVTINDNKNVVLVDTTVNLIRMQTPIQISTYESAVTVQTGVSMEDFLQFLEENGLGMYAVPAPGDITVGGAIAIGGHGTGIPYNNEVIPPGHALGTISNLIISFKAVVWDGTQYVVKTFQRTDVDASAFLIHLGRTFMTEVTLMVGKNYNLRCQSFTDIGLNELFSEPPGRNSISTLLNKTGRVELILYPFTTHPWVKIWTIEPTRPLLSRKVNKPYNYPFSNPFPESVGSVLGQIINGSWVLTPALGNVLWVATDVGLTATFSRDIWGPSKNLLLYIKPDTLRETANGYAVVTNRANVQFVAKTFADFYDKLIKRYKRNGDFPFNGPWEIRFTSLDKPVVGALPSLSPIRPIECHLEYDVAVYFDILSVPGTRSLSRAMAEVEQFFLTTFNTNCSVVRPEWSKGWAYTNGGAWTNEMFYREYIPSTFPSTTDSLGWDDTLRTLDRYDPNRIFTNSFIDSLFPITSTD